MDIQIDITNIRLETQRLILRLFEESDLADLNEYASVEGVGEMAGWKHHKTIEESKRILDMFIEEKNVFAIVLKENGKVIGSVGLHPSWANCEDDYRELKQKEVGYVLSKAYWGRGLVPEAVTAVIEYCFDTLDLDAVSVGYFKTNDQSRRVIEKCGFKFVKSDKYYAKQLDKTIDDMRYILLKEDFII